MNLIEGFVKDAVFVDFGSEIMYGSDQQNVNFPSRFPTVEFQLMATYGLSQIADRIRKDAGFKPMHGLLDVQLLGRGFAWLDTGTMSSLLQAANFVETIQSRQGIVISAPEEIAYINGFIDKEKLKESAALYGKSPYGEHLKAVAEGRVRY